jgi:glycerol-3-phosphate acyltransferase PlsX
MRIALDAMAGDFGPEPLVKGAIRAVEDSRDQVILVGDAETLEGILKRQQALHPRLSIVHADTVVGMGESPTASLKKKTSSLAVGTELVKSGEADAMVSAGNTGASLSMAMTRWRRLKGVSRPSLAAILPIPGNPVVLLDVGANVDCRPEHLFDFAVMGSVYAREIIGRRTPRIGLLNVGEEEGKGNEVSLATWEMLSRSSVNFIGNVEGRDVFGGKVDVIVCDGFVGNILLKFGEGVLQFFGRHLKTHLTSSMFTKLGALAIKPALMNFKRDLDADERGGVPLLGVNGIFIVCHGAANDLAIKNAIHTAATCVKHSVNEKIVSALADGRPVPKAETTNGAAQAVTDSTPSAAEPVAE